MKNREELALKYMKNILNHTKYDRNRLNDSSK